MIRFCRKYDIKLAAIACLAIAATACISACGKSASSKASGAPSAGTSASVGKPATPAASAAFVPESAPVAEDLWTRAKENVASGDGDDLARLADREGMTGILARSEDPAWRATAIRAMGYTGGFDALPWLAGVARGASNDDAATALDVLVDMAARPRVAVDPEDAAELREGCDALLALAKDGQAAKSRRIVAIRALRMLSDRGCVASADIPTDFDIK